MTTQKVRVLALLVERGAAGLSAREAIYDLHITRLAAIIFDLRAEGHAIRSENKPGETARYILDRAGTKPGARRCQCSHLARAHVAGMRCMAFINYERDCPCHKFTEAGS